LAGGRAGGGRRGDEPVGLLYIGNGQYGVYPEPVEGIRPPSAS